MRRRILFLLLIIFLLVCIATIKSCSFLSRDNDIKKKEDISEEKYTTRILNSADTYFVGGWNFDYKDIIHYTYDSKGTPIYDLYKQPGDINFTMVGEHLIMEEEYAIIDKKYNETDFTIITQLSIVTLEIKGKIIDENSWEGNLEYYNSGGEILSKCKVFATRKQ